MCAPLIQNTLVKQIRNYDHTPGFHSLVGATAIKS